MKHPGVIELKLYLSDINLVVMEYADLGSLYDYLFKRDTPIGNTLKYLQNIRLGSQAEVDCPVGRCDMLSSQQQSGSSRFKMC